MSFEVVQRPHNQSRWKHAEFKRAVVKASESGLAVLVNPCTKNQRNAMQNALSLHCSRHLRDQFHVHSSMNGAGCYFWLERRAEATDPATSNGQTTKANT